MSASETVDSAASAERPPPSAVFRAFDLWGVTRTQALYYAGLVITAAIVVMEVRYNIDLLNMLVAPEATREAVWALSDRGKQLASIGIAWACGRFLLSALRPAIVGVALLAGLGVGMYNVLDHLYTAAIRDLPAEVKVQGFSLFSYRRDLLTGRVVDPDVPLPKDHPVEGRIFMGALPIVLLDQRFMLPAADLIERKADDKVRFVLKDAEASWSDYANGMRDLIDGHKEFLAGSRQAFELRSMGGLDEFRRKSGGLEPNPTMTLNEFVSMLRKSPHAKGQTLRDAEARQIGRRPDGSVVLAGEVPKFLSKKQYLDWFAAQAKSARDEALPTAKTIDRMNGIQDINSAVFLPPMAMLASLTSALTNGLTLILLLGSLLAARAPWPPMRDSALWVRRFAAPLMMVLFACILFAAPRYVFSSAPLRALEDKMHSTVGIAGYAWSKLSAVQAMLLRLAN